MREIVDEADFVAPGPSPMTERLDSIFLHKVGGPLIFLGVVAPRLPVDLHLGGAAHGRDRLCDRHVRRLARRDATGHVVPITARRRRVGRGRLGGRLPAPDPDPLPLPGDSRGLGIHGQSRCDRGSDDVPGRPPGSGVPSASVRVRVCRAGDPGRSHDRRRAGSTGDDLRHPLYDVLGTAPRLRAPHCGVHSG